ncbi:MAG: hypothetical protein M3N82_00485 [Pseudomonadota bacterium]|nr:hypothetical protein [Pseudomonadota bacterium]
MSTPLPPPVTKAPSSLLGPPTTGAPPIQPKDPATGFQKIILCSLLIAFSAWTLVRTYYVIKQANVIAASESTTPWTLPAGAQLRAGPSSFYYDPERKVLCHRGPLDAAQQLLLRDLLEFDDEHASPQPAPTAAASAAPTQIAKANALRRLAPVLAASRVTSLASEAGASASATAMPNAISAAHSSSEDGVKVSAAEVKSAQRNYHAAIDRLAYKALDSQADQIQLLLYLGMLGGVLGALLRSFVDFVGNACYKQQLDLVVWWPLYVTRPVVGAMLGFLLVVLFKAKLLTNSDIGGTNDSFWWLGMAALGGFSTIDVTARLRQAAKALFGGN